MKKPLRVMFHNGTAYVRAVVVKNHAGEGEPVDVFAPDGDNTVRAYYSVPQQPEGSGGFTYYIEA